MGNSVCRSLCCLNNNSLQSHERSRCRKKTCIPAEQTISLPRDLNNKEPDCGRKDQMETYLHDSETALPPELIIEILSWLPVKVLVKLQLVCKHWYAIVQDRHFIESHMLRGSVTTYFSKINPTPLTYEIFSLICGCDGLLLRKSSVTRKYHIHNPTTRRVLELPDPKKSKLPVTFNFVRSTGEYKLVSTYDDEADRNGAFCEVLIGGSDNSWKALKIPNLNDVGKKRDSVTVVSTDSDSAVHWYQIYKVGSKFSREVVSLDLGTECFTITTLPNNMYRHWERVWALNWSGKLAFVEIVKEELRVLVLENYKRQKWSEKKTVIPLSFINKKGYLEADLEPVRAEHDIIWFWLKDKKLFSYNMKCGCILKTRSLEGCKITKIFYELRPSLVSFKGMKAEKELLSQQG